jgi:nucleoside-diphosphate-sugar epimerase
MSQQWVGRRVIVGGGCGFIGSYLVPVLVERGASVTVVDNLENGPSALPESVVPAVALIDGDLRDRQTCERVLRGSDLFINLAAKASGVGFSRTHHSEMLIDNLLCGLVPLRAAAEQGVPRIVVTSSSCVYPDDAPVPTPELNPFVRMPEAVNEGYGWAKRMLEFAAACLSRETGLKVDVLRPFNLYGANYPWRSAERAHVVPSLVKRVLDGEDPLVVWGSGEQRRNLLHGSDAAEVIVRVIESGAGEAVNIGYEDATSVAELVALICDVTGRHPAIVFDRSRPDGAPRKAADATRLRALTANYEPRVSLRQGIEEMVGWYERTFGQPVVCKDQDLTPTKERGSR